MEYDEKMRDAVAREIRKAYAERKERLIGRPWKPNARHKSFSLWQKAADQALELDAPPETYVHAAFQYCKMTTGPFPNNLGGPAAAGWWKQWLQMNPNFQKELEDLKELGLQSAMLNHQPAIVSIKDEMTMLRRILYRMTGDKEWPLSEKCLEIVRGPVLHMSPWMRLILGYPDEQIRVRYRDEIQEVLSTRPDIIRAMQSLGFDLDNMLEWLKK